MYFYKSLNESKKSYEPNVLNKLQLTTTTLCLLCLSGIFDKCDSIQKNVLIYFAIELIIYRM